MNTVFFSTGSNIGKRPWHLKFASKMLEKRIGNIVSKSSIYESQAWGLEAQRDFLNQVIVIETEQSAVQCLETLQDIEKQRFRERKQHWGPRTLDIDILFFNLEIINSQSLIIPHQFLANRLFVLLPLSEIFPDLIHPISGFSIKQLLTKCTDNSKVTRYKNGI